MGGNILLLDILHLLCINYWKHSSHLATVRPELSYFLGAAERWQAPVSMMTMSYY